MGSKRALLANGLGETILLQGSGSGRIVDLFSGSGAVAWYAAERVDCPTRAVDLQRYAAVLAEAVIARTHKLDARRLEAAWINSARNRRERYKVWKSSPGFN